MFITKWIAKLIVIIITEKGNEALLNLNKEWRLKKE